MLVHVLEAKMGIANSLAQGGPEPYFWRNVRDTEVTKADAFPTFPMRVFERRTQFVILGPP
jgi:hypothetical protein